MIFLMICLKNITSFYVTLQSKRMNLYNHPMFKSLDIKNFRGIRSAEIDGFERVNLFFGKNNCGKSTVLEALFLISGQSNPLLPLSVNSMRNYMRFSESDLNIEFFGLNPENKINISVNGDENRWLEISRIKSQSNVVELGSLGNGESDNAAKTYGIKLNYSVGERENRYSSELIIKEGDAENGKVKIDKRYKENLFSRYLTANAPQASIDEQFAQIVANKKEQKVLSILQEIEPRIKDIQLVGTELLVDIGESQRLPINMMGDGLRKLLFIIVSIYQCRNGLLLVDEIDNGLHFTAMEVLWKAVLKASADNNVQLFATTHNIDSLKGLAKVLKQPEYSEYCSDVCEFKLIKKDDASVVAVKYDYDSFEYAVNQELEIR